MAYMEPRALPYEEFPEEKETRPGVRTLTMDKNAYGTEHFPDVTYAVRDGAALHLQIFVPVLFGQSLDARYPLVVFVQGSAWRKQEIKLYKNARRANYASIGLLLVAMILLFISPNSLNGDVSNAVTVIIAYVLTVIAGCLILYTVKYVVPERTKMTKITAGVLIVIGAAGIFMTGSSLMNM